MNAPDLLAAAVPSCCDDETWKPIPGWPHHQASTCGRGRVLDRTDAQGRLRLGGTLPQHPDKRPGKGYLYFDLRDGRRRRRIPVAVAVLEAHDKPRPGPDYEACHLNDIRTDNHWPRNLAWDTRTANLARMWENRRRPRDATCDRHPPETSQESRSPRWAASRRLSQPVCHRDSLQGTVSPPFLLIFLSHFISVSPFIRSVRTSICTLRNRKAG